MRYRGKTRNHMLAARTLAARTLAAGLVGTIWPVTSQSKSMRMAANRCLAVGALWLRLSASI